MQFFAACEGVKPRSYFTQKQRTPAHLPQVRGPAPVKLRMKIVFPTMAEIRNTFGGYAHGGTIFCQEKQWNTSGFPCHLFHKGISKRSRVAAHTKTSELASQAVPASGLTYAFRSRRPQEVVSFESGQGSEARGLGVRRIPQLVSGVFGRLVLTKMT